MSGQSNQPAKYNYELPKNLIAQKPTEPRDSARLLVFQRKNNQIKFDIFKNLCNYLPKNAVLVFNQTRVIPARLPLYKQTGGKVEALYVGHSKKYLKVLSNKELNLKSIILLNNKGSRFKKYFYVVKKIDGVYYLKPNFLMSKINNIFKRYGLTPLPPYIKNSPLTEKQRRQSYQTIFAKTGESVAAPTASLHFTKSLIKKLKKNGIALKFVRLDVNLGTFAKLTPQQLKTGTLHSEKYFINASTATFIKNAKAKSRPIIAVGTTVARTLESYAKTKKLSGKTNLFIRPPYKFKIVNGLITNFHVPQSSLMMLVGALTGREKLLKLYKIAIQKKFRFFSFGDGMLLM